jgi:hypothetical protein
MEVYWLRMLHPPPKLALSEKYANSAKPTDEGIRISLFFLEYRYNLEILNLNKVPVKKQI